MKQIRLLVKLIIVSTCVCQAIGFNVRFDNESEYEDGVEIQYIESAVANDSRDEADYGGINGTVWFDSVSCTGAEYAIEQRAHRDGGQWESIKYASYSGDLINKMQQLCCNIDFQLSSEDSRKIMDGDNIYSTLSAAAIFAKYSLHLQ